MNSWRQVAVLAVWWGAALSLSLVLLNRAFIHLPDGNPKRLATLGMVVVLTSGALYFAWTRRESGVVVPVAFFALLGVGELRRAVLLHRYRASPPVVAGPSSKLLNPVTTTQLVARHYELPIANLGRPRLRIAHLSDLHVGGGLSEEYYKSAFELANQYQPDALFLTGDLLSDVEHLPELARVLESAQHPHLGSYAILGNHDHWAEAHQVRRLLTETGFTQVHGRCEELAMEGPLPLTVCGDEHPWGPRPSRQPASRRPASRHLKRGTLLVLSHTPDNIYAWSRQGATAVFAGHLHGGQLRLPGLGALVVPSRYGRRFVRGHFRVGDTHLLVSSGVGGIPLRLWCEPDVLIVDLVRGTKPR